MIWKWLSHGNNNSIYLTILQLITGTFLLKLINVSYIILHMVIILFIIFLALLQKIDGGAFTPVLRNVSIGTSSTSISLLMRKLIILLICMSLLYTKVIIMIWI